MIAPVDSVWAEEEDEEPEGPLFDAVELDEELVLVCNVNAAQYGHRDRPTMLARRPLVPPTQKVRAMKGLPCHEVNEHT